MMRPEHSLDDARDQAALYALGALRDAERREFEAHLRSGCTVCADEVRAFATVTTALATDVTPQPPRAAVRTHVVERIAEQSARARQPILDEGGLRFVRSDKIEWDDLVGDAIQIKLLFRDAERGYRTQLVRMAPGATYSTHRHAETEELYLLEGELLVSGVLMRAGDYCRAEPGTVHSDVIAPSGCVFIAMVSERDEILA